MNDVSESGTGDRGPPREQSSGAAHVTTSPGGSNLYFQPSAIVITLLAVVAMLAVASVVLQFLRYEMGILVAGMRLLDLEREANVPTWVSSLNLAACALLLLFIACAASGRNDHYAAHWTGLCIVFLYLSLDEACRIHESSWRFFQRLLDTSGALYPAWVIPAMVVVTPFALVYMRFLFSLPNKTRRLFVLAAVLYVGGAVGLEMLGWHYRYPLLLENPDDWEASKTMTSALIAHAEEVLEMVGVIVFMYALLEYLAWHKVRVELSFADGRSERSITGPERDASA
ncbi:MAG: hypothetical protein K0S35_1007 [Geminicoccaceae bacterium]|nr:hypothetical protein [Geminicoccaceae bacterium]